MNKYFVSEIYEHARFTAGVLREDIETSLRNEGFTEIKINEPKNLFQKLLVRIGHTPKVEKMHSPGLTFFHFPLRSRLIRSIFKSMRPRQINTVAYVHDLEGVRGNNIPLLNHEMSMIARADIVLVQNQEMKNIIAYKSGNKNIIVLEMYDYLQTGLPPVRSLSPVISFAGNLEKAAFIHQLYRLPSLTFIIYGQGVQQFQGNNLHFKGRQDPRLLPSLLEGSFGLVWDGDSLETGTGTGKYLQYNIPHKLALYIMAGLPLIVWKKSAMAQWVLKNKIGVVVESLFEVEQKISALTEVQYQEFRSNMIELRQKMSEGFYMKTAIRKALKIIREQPALKQA